MQDTKQTYWLYLAWAVALIAMLGSLYFSEIRHFPPCVLCWYQRICIYPMVIILLVGILKKDAQVHLYALPLAVIGLIISFYHNLLYYNIIPEALAPCVNGISCTTKYIEYFGFVTIPLLSFITLVVITASVVMYARSTKNHA